MASTETFGISTDFVPESDADGYGMDSMARAWGSDLNAITSMKSAGASITMETPGAANARYGPKIWQLPYLAHNTLSVLGQKNYESGKRAMLTRSIARNTSAGVVRNNYLTTPAIPEYVQLLEPYKVYSITRTMPLGFAKLGEQGRDDTVDYDQYIMGEGETLTWSEDNDVLRRIEDAPIVGLGSLPQGSAGPITSTERVGFESIERIISNSTEAGFLPDTYAIPWYNSGTAIMSSSGTDLSAYRGQHATQTGTMLDAYVDANYTAGTTSGEATLRELDLTMMDTAYFQTMPYWGTGDNKLSNKAWVTRYDTEQKLSGLIGPYQRLLGTEFINTTVNGVTTAPGRGAGMSVSTYLGLPIIPDNNVESGTVADTNIDAQTGVGRVYLLDQNSIYMAPFIAPRVNATDNPIMAQSINRMMVMDYHAEVQCTKFKSLAKIIHLQ